MKYLVLYNATLSAREVMAQSSPEQVRASMQEWIQWRDQASRIAKIDFGMPLQMTDRITPQEVHSQASPISGYALAECDDKHALLMLLQSHPHLKREGASIDLLEMVPMPGL